MKKIDDCNWNENMSCFKNIFPHKSHNIPEQSHQMNNKQKSRRLSLSTNIQNNKLFSSKYTILAFIRRRKSFPLYKQLIYQMFITSEDDHFRVSGHQLSYNTKKNTHNESSTLNSNSKSFERRALNFDSSFTDFTMTISKCLYKGQYMANPSLFNPFCPLCVKFIGSNDVFTICSIRNCQTYLIHDKCLIANSSFGMTLANEEQDDLMILKSNHFKSIPTTKTFAKNICLQYKDFLVEMIFYHPISEKKFGKIQKKVNLGKDKSSMQINLSDQEQSDEYSPNMVIMPFADLKVQIGIHLIGQNLRTKITKYINFKKLPSNDSKSVIFGNNELQFEVAVWESQKEKENVLDKMNYKYGFSASRWPLIVLKEIWFQLPEIFKEEESEEYDEVVQSSSSKVLQFLELDGKFSEENSQISKKTSQSNFSFESTRSKKGDMRKSQMSSQSPDHQKVNLDKLIKTDTLKTFVKHNTQSRSFQFFLQKASNQEIDKIIQHMKCEFCDLMKHEYGNYMMQKLFSVCNLERRLYILQILISHLSDIVMNKQGTHAFQDFLSFFTTDSQFILVLNNIRENFYQLCIHNNSTHFVQKIIKLFPMQLLNEFFYYCVQNIYQFSCDKNGMCVIKYMLRKLKEISDRTFDKSIKHQECLKLVQEYKKLFVQSTLFNLDGIIGDMYGNYVVQFNFEVFDPFLTSALTDSILMKLPQYSLSKYSTNVVYKCLNSYWVHQKEYISHVLKQVFQPYLILEMYKNKDGNKILLEIIEKYEGYEIWNRLYNILVSTEPTRFYHDRWGIALGCRSGNVGGNWSSFSDAMHKAHQKRKTNNFF